MPPLKSLEPFPWNRLPRELQVKILTSLSRRDLARCRLLNRETFEIIRASEGSMRRRHLELVRIERVGGGRVQLFVRCDEEETTRKWVACQKRKRRSVGGLSTDIKKALEDNGYLFPTTAALLGAIAAFGPTSPPSEPNTSSFQAPSAIIDRLSDVVRGSEIDRLRINEMKLSDDALRSIASCLVDADCRVRLLSFELTSLAEVSPSGLLSFVRDVAPTSIVFRMLRDCTAEHFGPEMCSVLASRRFFSVSELVDAQAKDVAVSMDDSILAQLSADTFHIAAPNRITADGLRSFIRGLSRGERELVAGRIQANFPVDGYSLLEKDDFRVDVVDQRTIDITSISSPS
ncbi:hypothetical protein Q1695_008503 [Nippostrongylus brasiliensis]|nr:hypothetical protein Q1695_008503 [Nippostrongylus brasiliensis]